MTTAKQAAANRRNSRKSTGPKSREGKLRASMNALRHGLCATMPVVPGEDPEHYRRVMEALRVEYDPRTPLEAMLVERAAAGLWRLARLQRIEAELLTADPAMHRRHADYFKVMARDGSLEPTAGELLAESYRRLDAWQLSRYEATIERAVYRALSVLDRRRDSGGPALTQGLDALANEQCGSGNTQQ